MERQVLVHLGLGGFDGPVGQLWLRVRGGRTTASFQYTPDWLGHPGRFELDPALPLRAGPFHAEGGFGCFRDAAPDRWGRQLIGRARARAAAAAGATPERLTEADYLLGVDDRTRHGALRFREGPDGPFLGAPRASAVPPLVQLARLLGAAEKLDAGAEDDDDLAVLLAPGSSLGGARPKASVLGRDGELWMAKFPRRSDGWNVPRWEGVALSLARAAGIAVADARLEEVRGGSVLIVRRFDRVAGRRIPFLSAMTMLGAADRETRSYPEIAEAIRRYGASPAADLKELWRRMVFTVLVSNHDDHLRNHGFLRLGDGGWRLAPAYDLNPTPAEEGGRFLTTGVVAEDPRASLEPTLGTARYYGLGPAAARGVLAEVSASVDRWRAEARRFGAGRAEVDRMASAFEHPERDRARAGAVVV
ncbi:MAG: type II toxin-antitoxin system HipA family toxin [Acidobacteria bacterium]|nr:type II toxin-antitoxin system HipA family toxin [Acidobacteriota bacterium]MYE44330.1 type II toxin-antitoxin system HipA family toxin [Acidobacteriota bacterium]